jgi:hypothetical protein
MNKMKTATLFLVLLLTAACATPTAQEKGKLIKGSIDVSRAGCLALLADPTIPREQSTVEHCTILLNGCPKLSIKEEVRSVP